MGSQPVSIGRHEQAYVSRIYPTGKIDVTFRAGTQTFCVRCVAWNSIYVPPALREEYEQCRVLAWAFERILPLELDDLLPLDFFARRTRILSELEERGISPESIHRSVIRTARGRADLAREFVIDAVLEMEKPSSARRARSRIAAGRAYLCDAYRQIYR